MLKEELKETKKQADDAGFYYAYSVEASAMINHYLTQSDQVIAGCRTIHEQWGEVLGYFMNQRYAYIHPYKDIVVVEGTPLKKQKARIKDGLFTSMQWAEYDIFGERICKLSNSNKGVASALTDIETWQEDWKRGCRFLENWQDAYEEIIEDNKLTTRSQLRTAVTMRQGLDKSLKPRKETKKAKVHYEYLLPPKPKSKRKQKEDERLSEEVL